MPTKTSQEYLNEAARAERLAQGVNDVSTREDLFGMAEAYRKLAARAARAETAPGSRDDQSGDLPGECPGI